MAIIETKNRAMDIVAKLDEQLDFPRKIRMHWTGCPNSCAQACPAAYLECQVDFAANLECHLDFAACVMLVSLLCNIA